MRVLATMMAALAIAGCAHAPPQAPIAQSPGEAAEHDYTDAQIDATRAAKGAYRGHVPFAVASYRPFGDRRWFVLSFFNYWTDGRADDERRWFVRRVAGAFEGSENGQAAAEEGARTTWADSAHCPQLLLAVARFEVHERAGFMGPEQPPVRSNSQDGDVIVVSTFDASWISFWARLRGDNHRQMEVAFSAPASDGGISGWVFETLDAIDDCFSERPPAIPERQTGAGGRDTPLDIFG
jgi:hypothetical protein